MKNGNWYFPFLKNTNANPDEGNFLISLFLDLNKIFDCIDYEIL